MTIDKGAPLKLSLRNAAGEILASFLFDGNAMLRTSDRTLVLACDAEDPFRRLAHAAMAAAERVQGE